VANGLIVKGDLASSTEVKREVAVVQGDLHEKLMYKKSFNNKNNVDWILHCAR